MPVLRSRVPALLLLFGAAGACTSVPGAKALAEADYGQAPAGAWQTNVRTAFADLLIDAAAAEYRHGAPEKGWGRSEQGFVYGWVVWTEVNSKNRFGALTGWQPYKVLLQSSVVHSIYEPKGKDPLGNPKFERVR